ncbi:ABC transporter ATP-binding protein [Streptomyces sp. RB6PN25]|uniref:ABC transporter ATP-binding protein n=1 Tax=Streptomyces humicola TaxID=2953240 RepID=A0ABT1PPD6_9ACTN|nr:ABC transporter ATP-binding protein [Streptomyces humicola]MCQ4079542.1 ABC transporter ATP-binding protein [Streptomyces humicola]
MSETPASPVVAVRITGVRKAYGRTPVLHGVDLTVEKGTITALLGPSGSGKTTLLRVIAGFERADVGTVELGHVVADNGKRTLAPEKRRIGYVPQDGALFPHLSVRANIGFALSRAARRDGRVDQLLELTGLTSLAERHPHQLSGGQQQRVALARALAHNPSVVLLDEPFSALDTALRASVRSDILAILRTTGTTAILVTHDQDEALSTADRIAVLRDGLIAQHGTAQELYDTPNDPTLAAFVGDANLLTATLTGDGTADAGPLGRLTLRESAGVAGSGTVLIRPEQLALAGERGPGDGVLEARVEACEYFGHDTMLTVRPQTTGDHLPELLRARLPEGVRLASGTTVRLTVRGPVTAWPAPAS